MIRRLTIGFLFAAITCLASAQTRLTGAGATFPYPIYSKWFTEYNKFILTWRSTTAAASAKVPADYRVFYHQCTGQRGLCYVYLAANTAKKCRCKQAKNPGRLSELDGH